MSTPPLPLEILQHLASLGQAANDTGRVGLIFDERAPMQRGGDFLHDAAVRHVAALPAHGFPARPDAHGAVSGRRLNHYRQGRFIAARLPLDGTPIITQPQVARTHSVTRTAKRNNGLRGINATSTKLTGI